MAAPRPSNRLSFAKIREPLEVPNLLDLQVTSFDWLVGNELWQSRVQEAVDANPEEILAYNNLGALELVKGNRAAAEHGHGDRRRT